MSCFGVALMCLGAALCLCAVPVCSGAALICFRDAMMCCWRYAADLPLNMYLLITTINENLYQEIFIVFKQTAPRETIEIMNDKFQ